jgi:hypothetical protein
VVGTPFIRVRAGMTASFRYDAAVDKGWVLDRDAGVWQLLGSRGEIIWQVRAACVEQGAGGVNAHGARRPRFWPPLRPGRPYVHCVLTGGPFGELHEYYDPDEYPGPPELVVLDFEQALPGMPDGPRPAAAVAARAEWRRQIQGCGHGDDCPYPYALNRGWSFSGAGP